MKTRIITAVVGIALLIPLLIFFDTYAFVAGMAFLSMVGCFEMLRVEDLHKNYFFSVPILLLAGFVPFSVRCWGLEILPYVLPLLLAVLLYALLMMVLCYGKRDVHGVGAAFMGCLYVIAGFSAMVAIPDNYGLPDLALVFVGAWVTDTFAYFSGRLFGKHKLIPAVSPKKTVEGSLGGMLFCVIGFFVWGLLYYRDDLSALGRPETLLFLIVGGLLASVVSQIGDLSMSVFKRQQGIKDFGKLFPGHGGVLDRFDSTLAVAVAMLIFLLLGTRVTYLNFIGF